MAGARETVNISKPATARKDMEKRLSDASSSASSLDSASTTFGRVGPVTREEVLRTQRGPNTATARSALGTLAFQVDTFLGGMLYHNSEKVVIYLVLLILLPLLAMGAGKQLAGLATSVMAATRRLTAAAEAAI
ncbi:hypothetical protein Agub_g11918 [Astrephomene gubernaculifera]|uniref:Uncharacterized protein n=1 Tax=Astrephomene gubernaculifera TaxID=47775 RepID=A0AAD3HQU5_9CHLO|nr:hypothetical protein Agub_g11918 [Astrephomene gubernaculifera]